MNPSVSTAALIAVSIPAINTVAKRHSLQAAPVRLLVAIGAADSHGDGVKLPQLPAHSVTARQRFAKLVELGLAERFRPTTRMGQRVRLTLKGRMLAAEVDREVVKRARKLMIQG